MNDVYCEHILKRKLSGNAIFTRTIAVFFSSVAILLGTIVNPGVGLVGGIFFIYLTYILFKNTDIEYEYQYVSGELDIDVIYGRRKRKRARRFNIHKIEIMAPLGSDKLEYYEKNRTLKVMDYSSRYDVEGKYAFIIPNDEGYVAKVIIEPSESMVEQMKMIEPSKVHVN